MTKRLISHSGTVICVICVLFVLLIYWASTGYDMPGKEYRSFLTGEVSNIELTKTSWGEAIVFVRKVEYFTDAAGNMHKLVYTRKVFFRDAEEIANVKVGDVITISGVENYPSYYNGKIEQIDTQIENNN